MTRPGIEPHIYIYIVFDSLLDTWTCEIHFNLGRHLKKIN